MNGNKKVNFSLIVMLSMLVNCVFIYTSAAEETKWLEPEIVDNAFEQLVGRHIEKVTGDQKLKIAKIPGFDDALDEIGKISPFDIEIGFTLANIYLWRGQNLGNDASWMPYVTVSPDFEPLGDLSFTYWADITQHMPGKDDLEYDFVVDYTVDILEILKLVQYDPETSPYLLTKLMDISFSTGYIYYWFPPSCTDSHEVYWSMEYNLPLHPSFAIYNDFDQGRGIWYEWGVSQDFDLKLITLSTFATLGYNHRQWGESSKLSIFHFGGSVPFEIGTHTVIEPFLSYSKRANRTYTADGSDLTTDELYGGFNFSIGF